MRGYARVGIATVGTGLLLMSVSPAAGAPGDPRIVRGTIEWPTTPEATPFIVLRGDDGRRYSADLSAAVRGQVTLTAGSRVTVAGVEGSRSHEIAAVSVTPAEGVRTPVLAPAPAPPPRSSIAPAEPPPQRLDGRVEGVSGSTLVVATSDGRRVVVDLASLGPRLDAVRVGDEVTVFGRHEGRRFLANGFIQVEETGAAFPRPRR